MLRNGSIEQDAEPKAPRVKISRRYSRIILRSPTGEIWTSYHEYYEPESFSYIVIEITYKWEFLLIVRLPFTRACVGSACNIVTRVITTV